MSSTTSGFPPLSCGHRLDREGAASAADPVDDPPGAPREGQLRGGWGPEIGSLPRNVTEALHKALRKAKLGQRGLACRSSSSMEDFNYSALPGVFLSVLGIADLGELDRGNCRPGRRSCFREGGPISLSSVQGWRIGNDWGYQGLNPDTVLPGLGIEIPALAVRSRDSGSPTCCLRPRSKSQSSEWREPQCSSGSSG